MTLLLVGKPTVGKGVHLFLRMHWLSATAIATAVIDNQGLVGNHKLYLSLCITPTVTPSTTEIASRKKETKLLG